jgi:choline dehydrogenase-like flavoprotein
MAEHMSDFVEELFRAAGGELVDCRRGELDEAGSAIHEHGTCRMGADPRRSALNAFNQMHEVKNVEKNPTLTILALSWRATDYLAERLRTGDL